MFRKCITGALSAAVLAFPAAAMEEISSPYPVAETMDNLVAAVEAAGANVVARVDHSGSASDVDMELTEAQLLIFGNPKVGTPIMQQDIQAGVVLPLRVLVYAGDDGTHVAWSSADELFAGLDVDLESEPVKMMTGALQNLTAKAVE